MLGKKSIIIFMLIVVACGNDKVKNDCDKWKTGDFLFKPQNASEQWVVDRNDTIQVETGKKTGNVSTYRVKWSGPCEYELYFVRRVRNDTLTDKGEKIVVESKELKDVVSYVATILESRENFYLFKIAKPGTNFSITDTMWVLK